jgi:hypothetical protein
LLQPLGSVHVEPNLVELLFDLDHTRMHLMALARAHLASDVTPDLALLLLSGLRNEILNLSLGHRPVGIDHVLNHLPPKVLAAESYRKLTTFSAIRPLPSSGTTANQLTTR